MVNDYNEVTVVGTATAPHGDIQVMKLFLYWIMLPLNCVVFCRCT
jgi:hypothetical protein